MSDKDEGAERNITKLTKEHKDSLRFLIEEKNRMDDHAERFKEDVKGLAERLGVKPKKVSSLIKIVMQEEKKGGIVEEQSAVLELAEQMLGSK